MLSKLKKQTFSSNIQCYNLSICAVKVFKKNSTHFHNNLVQICVVEFWKKKNKNSHSPRKKQLFIICTQNVPWSLGPNNVHLGDTT